MSSDSTHCWNSAWRSAALSLTETLIDRVGLFRQAATACRRFPNENNFSRLREILDFAAILVALDSTRGLHVYENTTRRVINISMVTCKKKKTSRTDLSFRFIVNGNRQNKNYRISTLNNWCFVQAFCARVQIIFWTFEIL